MPCPSRLPPLLIVASGALKRLTPRCSSHARSLFPDTPALPAAYLLRTSAPPGRNPFNEKGKMTSSHQPGLIRLLYEVDITLDGAMTTWLTEYWYVFTGLGGSLLLLVLYVYARRHPQSLAMSLWQRLFYTAVASAVASGIFALLTAVFFPSAISVLQSPIFPFALLAVMWLAAPYIRRWIPLERSQS